MHVQFGDRSEGDQVVVLSSSENIWCQHQASLRFVSKHALSEEYLESFAQKALQHFI